MTTWYRVASHRRAFNPKVFKLKVVRSTSKLIWVAEPDGRPGKPDIIRRRKIISEFDQCFPTIKKALKGLMDTAKTKIQAIDKEKAKLGVFLAWAQSRIEEEKKQKTKR